MTLLPTNPVRAAELAVILRPNYMPLADLIAACVVVRTLSQDHIAIAHGARFERAVAAGQVA